MAGVLLAFTVVGMIVILSGAPLAYDEAVYAARAREFVTGDPAITWHVFRPPGLAVLGTVAALTDWWDVSLRAITLGLGLLALLATWLLARLTVGAAAALLTLATLASAPAVLRAAALFLNDLGSIALLLASMAVLWVELERRPAPTWRLLLVAPLWAGAFYLRYGAVLILAGIVIVTAAMWWRTLIRHWRLASAVVVLTAILLVPHVAESIAVTGTPWGTLLEARDATRDAPLLTTVRTYLGWLLDGTLSGPLGPVLIAFGVTVGPLLVAARWRGSARSGEARGMLWAGLIALVVSVPIATSAAPEARYAFPPLVLGLIVGSTALLESVSWMATRLREPRLLPAATGVLVAALLVSSVIGARGWLLDARRAAATDGWRTQAAEAIAVDSGGNCSLVVPWPLRPTFFWYAACPTAAGRGGVPPLTPWTDDGGIGYVVVHLAASEGRQIPADMAAAYREMASGAPIATYRGEDGSVLAEVLRIDP